MKNAFLFRLNNLHACNTPDTSEKEKSERAKAIKQIINGADRNSIKKSERWKSSFYSA